MRVIGLLTVLASMAATGAFAQQLPLQPGQRVRVTVPSLDVTNHQATFQRLNGDTLVLSSASYSLSDLTRLDVYAGRQSHPWRGAALGFLGGAVIGATIMAVAVDSDHEQYVQAVLFGAGIGAGSGLVIGTVAGAAIKTDKWEEVPLDRLLVGVIPQRGSGRLGLGISMSF